MKKFEKEVWSETFMLSDTIIAFYWVRTMHRLDKVTSGLDVSIFKEKKWTRTEKTTRALHFTVSDWCVWLSGFVFIRFYWKVTFVLHYFPVVCQNPMWKMSRKTQERSWSKFCEILMVTTLLRVLSPLKWIQNKYNLSWYVF